MPVPYAYIQSQYIEEYTKLLERNEKLKEELTETKKLLALATDDIHELLCDKESLENNGQSCNICSYIENCPCCTRCDIRPELRQWRYIKEVKKLLPEYTEKG